MIGAFFIESSMIQVTKPNSLITSRLDEPLEIQ